MSRIETGSAVKVTLSDEKGFKAGLTRKDENDGPFPTEKGKELHQSSSLRSELKEAQSLAFPLKEGGCCLLMLPYAN